MQWNVRIVDEDNKPMSEEDVVVPVSILSKMGPDSVMLRGIDPYLNTTFNSAQIEFFIKEWEELASRVEPKDKVIWETVMSYARRCLEPHVYLKFIGD